MCSHLLIEPAPPCAGKLPTLRARWESQRRTHKDHVSKHVSPPLAQEARDALDAASVFSGRAFRYRTLDTILRATGTGTGRNEILSYVFFDPEYFKRQFKLGEAHAQATNGVWRTTT